MEQKGSQNESCKGHEAKQNEEDIDASLLCPDVIVNEQNIQNMNNDIDNYLEENPLDYNIIGIKAHFQLSSDEEDLRQKTYKIYTPIQITKIHCTSCNRHLGSALKNIENVFIHPLLTVIICKECFDFYTAGEFELDEDGQEKFCRWCGQGGKLFCCNECPRVFCTTCVTLNFSFTQYNQIRKSDHWKCFICDPSLIMHFKVQCFEFAKYVCRELMRLEHSKEKGLYMDMDYTQCCITKRGTKRRLETKDPDFVPGENVNEKSKRRMKSTKNKRQDDWVMGQIPNTEYKKENLNSEKLIRHTQGISQKNISEVVQTKSSITSSDLKLKNVSSTVVQSKPVNIDLSSQIPKSIFLTPTAVCDQIPGVSKTTSGKNTFASFKPISVSSEISPSIPPCTNTVLTATKMSNQLVGTPKTAVLKNTFTALKPIGVPSKIPSTSSTSTNVSTSSIMTGHLVAADANTVVSRNIVDITKPITVLSKMPSIFPTSQRIVLNRNLVIPRNTLLFPTVPAFKPIHDNSWIENRSILRGPLQQQQTMMTTDKKHNTGPSLLVYRNQQSLLITALANSTYGSSLLTMMLNKSSREQDQFEMWRSLNTCLQTFIDSLTFIESTMKNQH